MVQFTSSIHYQRYSFDEHFLHADYSDQESIKLQTKKNMIIFTLSLFGEQDNSWMRLITRSFFLAESVAWAWHENKNIWEPQAAIFLSPFFFGGGGGHVTDLAKKEWGVV